MKIALALAALLIVTGCTTPISTKEAQELPYDCSNVRAKIALLEKELEDNNNRTQAGITALVPFSAVAHLIDDTYMDQVDIATGKWAKTLRNKRDEMYGFERSRCIKR